MNWPVSLAGLSWRQPPRPLLRPSKGPVKGPVKGDYNSTCQRYACENPAARWYNRANGKYYCSDCARTFNEVARHQGRLQVCELHLSR